MHACTNCRETTSMHSTAQKEKADRLFGDIVPDNGASYGKSMHHTAFGENAGVAVDKNDGDSGKEEDEGPPPLRDGPSSDSNEDDDSYDEIADNDNVDNVATTDDDSEAIKL